MEKNEKTPEELNAEINKYHSDLFVGSQENKSIKDKIDTLQTSIVSYHTDSSEKLEQIKKYYTELFESSDTRSSIEEEIKKFYKELFEDTEENTSLKNEIDSLLDKTKNEYSLFSNQVSEVNQFHNKLFIGNKENISVQESIDALYIKLFTDKEDKDSLESQFTNLFDSLKKRFSSTDEKFNRLEKFYDEVFNDKKNDDGTITKPSLINSIKQQQNKLDSLIKEANEKLYALTDSSLHNAFAKRADEYTTEFTRLEGITHKLTWAVIGDILLFGIIQVMLIAIGKSFDYHI